MKGVLKPFITSKPETARIAAGLAMMTLLGAVWAAETPSKGYLSRMGPPALRFSPPPKPPVLFLGSHPGTFTPPSVFVTEFAAATNAIRALQTNIVVPLPAVLTPAASGPSRQGTTNQNKAAERPTESNDLTLQVLVKYFAEKTPNFPLSPLKEPMGFQMPLKGTNSQSAANSHPK